MVEFAQSHTDVAAALNKVGQVDVSETLTQGPSCGCRHTLVPVGPEDVDNPQRFQESSYLI